MNQKLRNILQRLLMAVFLVSTLILVWQTIDKAGGSRAYENALDIATRTAAEAPETETTAVEETVPALTWVPAPIEGEDPYLAELEKLDISALQAENPQVHGWIFLPDTQIHYPVLQGEDNEYYLHHTWDGKWNSVGSIFLESQNSPDFTDFNTIVYGHNMKDGSMFAGIGRFMDQAYFDSHPYVYIATPEGIFRYETFAAFKAPVESPVYGLGLTQEKSKQDFLAFVRENSVVTSSIQPEITDRILTLSTCTGYGYTNRWVVLARLSMVQVPES